jgi:hypothetical protein
VGVPGLFGIAWPAWTDGPRRRWLAARGPRGISTSALRERLCAHTNSFAEESGHWRDITIAYGPRGDRVSACSTNAASSCVLRSALRHLPQRLRSQPHFGWKLRAPVEVGADVLGEILPTPRAYVRPATERIGREFPWAGS